MTVTVTRSQNKISGLASSMPLRWLYATLKHHNKPLLAKDVPVLGYIITLYLRHIKIHCIWGTELICLSCNYFDIHCALVGVADETAKCLKCKCQWLHDQHVAPCWARTKLIVSEISTTATHRACYASRRSAAMLLSRCAQPTQTTRGVWKWESIGSLWHRS